MAVLYPSTLPKNFNRQDFNRQTQDTTIRTQSETGASKVRRRFTKPIINYSGSMLLDKAQYEIMENFYNTLTAAGTIPFEWKDPITEVTSIFRFTSTIKYTSAGGEWFNAAFSIEKLPT